MATAADGGMGAGVRMGDMVYLPNGTVGVMCSCGESGEFRGKGEPDAEQGQEMERGKAQG